MVIINPNAPSVSNFTSNRGDGQVESTQVDARQSQQARRPDVAQQPTATQAANAPRPAQANNDIPLLNNRDRAVSDAIRQAPADNDEGIANVETAARESAALNQAQAVASSQTLQRLADIAQARTSARENGENVGQTIAEAIAPSGARPAQGQTLPTPEVEAAPTAEDIAQQPRQSGGFEALVNDAPAAPVPAAQAPAAPTAGFDVAAAPAAPQFTPPTPAFQVLQNSQQRLNDILLPDFANFIGLRASLPAQTQAEQQIDNQPTTQPRPIDVEV